MESTRRASGLRDRGGVLEVAGGRKGEVYRPRGARVVDQTEGLDGIVSPANFAIGKASAARSGRWIPSGRFHFTDVPPGEHDLTVRHIGYGTVEAAIDVVGGRRLDLTVRLTTAPIALDPIEVAVEALPGADVSGFYERRRRGAGHFFTREDLLEQRVTRRVDVLREVPAVELDCLSAVGVCRPRMRRVTPQIAAGGGECPIQYFVDGIPFDTDLGLEAFHPDDIEGIEIFPGGASIPIQFGGSDARCGVIAIWTRRGGR